MHNGLHSLPGRSVHRKAAGGWQPEWVSFPRVLGNNLGDGSGLHRLSALTGQPNPCGSLTFVMRLRNPNLAERNRYWSAEETGGGVINAGSGSASLDDNPTPRFTFNGRASDTSVQFNHGGMTILQNLQREYVVAATLSCSAGLMHSAVFQHSWLDGTYVPGGIIEVAPITYPAGPIDLGADYWGIGGGNYHLGGEMAYFWLQAAADASAYVDLTDPQVRGELMGNPEDWTALASPLIWFQGPASEWNSGVNRGSGGDFFVNAGHELTDAPRFRQ